MVGLVQSLDFVYKASYGIQQRTFRDWLRPDMEPLGASDLNEELEDDRQVSTDIIVATVCDFSPVKV